MTNEQLAKSIENGFFGKRDSLGEAMAYANEIFANVRRHDHIPVVTAMQVLLNTLADEIRKVKQ